MIKTVAITLMLILLTPSGGDILVQAQSKPTTNAALFNAKSERFLNYAQDFLGFAKSQGDNASESEVAMNLFEIASNQWERLSAAGTLLEIRDNLSCAEDRATVRLVIAREFLTYRKLTANSLESTNNELTHANNTAVVTEGMRMRDELREVEKMFGVEPK